VPYSIIRRWIASPILYEIRNTRRYLAQAIRSETQYVIDQITIQLEKERHQMTNPENAAQADELEATEGHKPDAAEADGLIEDAE
jgi:prophage antirepressor-like protein